MTFSILNSPFSIIFRRFDNRYQEFDYFLDFRMDGFVAILPEVVRLAEKINPVVGFISFLQCDAHLADEIRLALCVFRFSYQSADGCAAAENLTGKYKFLFFVLKIFRQLYYSQSKGKRFLNSPFSIYTGYTMTAFYPLVLPNHRADEFHYVIVFHGVSSFNHNVAQA